jgi:hypothetical protein
MITLSLPIDLPIDCLYDIIVSAGGMGNSAGGAILHIIFDCKIAFAVEKIKRTPAEQAGLPFGHIVTGIERAFLMDEILVVHGTTPPSGSFYVC